MSGNIDHGPDHKRLRLTTKVAASYLSNHKMSIQDVAALLGTLYQALGESRAVHETSIVRPAVSVGKSIMPDFLICLEDGKRLQMLKRHLRTAYGMTPDQYRAKWNLPGNYPMVSPAYAISRRRAPKSLEPEATCIQRPVL